MPFLECATKCRMLHQMQCHNQHKEKRSIERIRNKKKKIYSYTTEVCTVTKKMLLFLHLLCVCKVGRNI